MKILKVDELQSIRGGSISAYALLGISALVVFISGIIDGIFHPKKCS